MTNLLKSMVSQQVNWLNSDKTENDVVLCSMARLSRNLQDRNFSAKATREERSCVLEEILDAADQLPCREELFAFELDTLRENERVLLAERHLFNLNNLFDIESGLIVEKEEKYSVFVNSEDHLTYQAINSGLRFDDVWQAVNECDDLFATHLNYAFHDDYGYLTSNPANVGTGLKLTAYLDLSGLALTEQLNKFVHSARVLGMNVIAENSSEQEFTTARLFLSSRRTLGIKEESIVEEFQSFVEEAVAAEKLARQKLQADFPERLEDHISRAYGLLKYCRLIDEEDARNCLLTLRCGVLLGFFDHLAIGDLEYAYTFSKDAHLEVLLGKQSLPPAEIDKERATFLKKVLLKLN